MSIVSATTSVLAADGWGALAFTRVAERAGLSERPVRDRFDTREALAVAAWQATAGPALAEAIGVLVESGTDADALTQALRRFTHPETEMRACREIVLVGRYEPSIDEAVRATVGPLLGPLLQPSRGSLTRAQAAGHAYLLGVALGLLLHADMPGAQALDLTRPVAELARALANPVPARYLPSGRFEHLDRPVTIDTPDILGNAALTAILLEVSAHGYDAATIDSIARASGYSQGVIFNRYRTKRDLFIDASSRMLTAAAEQNATALRAVAASSSEAIAQAVMLREMMRPHRAHLRTITLEQLRLANHEPELMASIERAVHAAVEQLVTTPTERADLAAHIHFGLATGDGPLLLADWEPTAWKLPFDTITGSIDPTH